MLTSHEYELHRETVAKRDAIISELRGHETTHITIRPTWHGYDIEAGTHLVASPELGELLGRSEVRDAHGCVANWYVLENGHIANLWACEVDEYEAPYCSVCEDSPMLSLPKGVNVSPSGTMATCDFCSFKCGYWECSCELVHECEGNE